MRYFIDCEFSERGARFPIELISIGVVAEDGREFYRENRSILLGTLSPWIREHVIPHLLRSHPAQRGHATEALVQRPREIARDLLLFIGHDATPEFWAYYGQFDFVVLQQLFGNMSAWPQGWPMYCNDLRAWMDMRGFDAVRQPDDAPHDALADARWIAQTFRQVWAPGAAVTEAWHAVGA